MIGNREITDRARNTLWQDFKNGSHGLPESVRNLILDVYNRNENTDAGFRRQNLPSLLYKYFLDMKMVFEGMVALLKPGASAFVVVGNNHTIAGGERVEINTIDILGELAEQAGLISATRIEMEMLLSRDIFKSNAIGAESIL